MKEAKDSMEKIIKRVETGDHPSKDSLLEKLQAANKLIIQNQGKIWLMTRSGKPMAEKLQSTVSDALKENASTIETVINKILEVAKEIDEESQSRNMVVT